MLYCWYWNLQIEGFHCRWETGRFCQSFIRLLKSMGVKLAILLIRFRCFANIFICTVYHAVSPFPVLFFCSLKYLYCKILLIFVYSVCVFMSFLYLNLNKIKHKAQNNSLCLWKLESHANVLWCLSGLLVGVFYCFSAYIPIERLPGVVEGVSALGRGVGTRWPVRSLPT